MFEFYKNWMEFFFAVLMILGILIALLAPSAAISYVIISLSGIFAGRLIYERRHKIQLPYFMIIVGFVIGYLLGVYYGSRRVVIVLFVLGAVAGYKLYEKGVLKDVRF
ncbi:hypothetical protein HYW20_01015 [Candidatus Woesearchaeota archaeon]|nr:hypothetical protein [Candidatus Woesearchaeota archaeon]